jgi:hypothetical protein
MQHNDRRIYSGYNSLQRLGPSNDCDRSESRKKANGRIYADTTMVAGEVRMCAERGVVQTGKTCGYVVRPRRYRHLAQLRTSLL